MTTLFRTGTLTLKENISEDKMSDITKSDTDMLKSAEGKLEKPPHHVRRLLLLGATWCVLVLNMFFTAMAQVDATVIKSGLFLNTTGDAFDYYLEIRPASWAFAIWGPIYIMQVLWMSYATSTVFRRCGDTYLFYIDYLHPSLYIIYMANLCFSTTWTFLWDRQHPLPALFFLMLMTFTLYLLIVISTHGIYKYHAHLAENGRTNEYKYVIAFVHNAFGIYGTWCTIATLLNLGNVIAYSHKVVDQEVACAIMLSILAFEIMIYMLIDLGWLERYTRFMWTPYIVLMWALAASLQRNYSATKPNSIISLALILAVLFFTALKVVLVIYREWRDPVFGQRRQDGRVSPFTKDKEAMVA